MKCKDYTRGDPVTNHFLSYRWTLSLGSVTLAFKVVSDFCSHSWSQEGENCPEFPGFMSNMEKT